jgi:hypothetical protein
VILLFPILKIRLKRWHFETVSDIHIGNCKWYSIALSKTASMVLLKCGKNDEIAVNVPKTILKEMEAKIEQVKPSFLSFFFT